MSSISSAVAANRLSTVLGYEVKKGTAGVTGGYLPRRIAIIGEANTANQAVLKTKFQFTSAEEVAVETGYGSPCHLAALRLRGQRDVGGIPTFVFPLPEAGGAVAQVINASVTGTATKAATQSIIIAGVTIPFVVDPVDDADAIMGKVKDAVNAVINIPVIGGTVAVGVLPLTAKWAGQTGNQITVEFSGEDVGLTFSAIEDTAGAGEVLPTAALALFGAAWFTEVVNCLGETATVLNAYEAFNGNSTDKTGRYNAESWKPFICFTGTAKDDKDDLVAITTGRKTEQTNVVIPAPKSLSMPMEIGAVTCAIWCLKAEFSPKADVLDEVMTGIVPPQDLIEGDLDIYDNRDFVVKGGCSTSELVDGNYVIKDLVTTYHPDGELPPQFRWVRNLAGIDFNVAYRILFIDAAFIKGKTILPDANPSTDKEVIKPKDAKGFIINKLFVPFANEGIFSESKYSIENSDVQINGTNPDRLDFVTPYKRSGFARITSTTAIANFELGGD